MKQRESRFAACHPMVTFSFFMAAIVGSMFFQHPAYTAVSMIAAALLLVTEKREKALPLLGGMLPLFLLLSAVNPLFNAYGTHILFRVFGRPYTVEALLYGAEIAGMLIAALLWFACYSAVMTSDKFTCLFGNLIPALSLVLVMVLRLIPSYQRKAVQISGARRCIGKAPASSAGWKEKVRSGVGVLSALTSWALEGAIITADSMRSRGYGVSKRTSFQIYRWRWSEAVILAALVLLFGSTVLSAAYGWTRADFTPVLYIAPLRGSWGLIAYAVLLLFPTGMNLAEEIKWKYLESKI